MTSSSSNTNSTTTSDSPLDSTKTALDVNRRLTDRLCQAHKDVEQARRARETATQNIHIARHSAEQADNQFHAAHSSLRMAEHSLSKWHKHVKIIYPQLDKDNQTSVSLDANPTEILPDINDVPSPHVEDTNFINLTNKRSSLVDIPLPHHLTKRCSQCSQQNSPHCVHQNQSKRFSERAPIVRRIVSRIRQVFQIST